MLFTVPLGLTVGFCLLKDHRTRIRLLAFAAILVLLVEGIYVIVKVEAPGDRIVETVGLPATVWCSVMQEDPSALPEETQEVFYEITTKETYENIYDINEGFNSIKWADATNLDIIDQMSYADVIKYTAQCFYYAPKASIRGLSKLTVMVWGTKIDISENNVNITLVSSLMRVVKSCGFLTFVLLAYGMYLFAKNRLSFVYCIPLLCYNFGTMLLLSGLDFRFFCIAHVLCFPVLYLMYKDERNIMVKVNFRKKEKNTCNPGSDVL